MRYAVLSDIHSNLEALTAVLDDLQSLQIDRYLCLGDVVGYGADPSACLARLQSFDAVMVGGNHDLACIGKVDLERLNAAACAAVVWTRDQLSFTELDALRRLPLTETVECFTLVHGTLRHPARFDYLWDAADVVDSLAVCRTRFCLIGHTHQPLLAEYDRGRRRLVSLRTGTEAAAASTYLDEPDRVYLVNPGSVGQPRDGDPRASYAVIETDARRIEVRRVPYDVPTAQRKIRAAGLPEILADRLAVGW